jgi:hypothetical protein
MDKRLDARSGFRTSMIIRVVLYVTYTATFLFDINTLFFVLDVRKCIIVTAIWL